MNSSPAMCQNSDKDTYWVEMTGVVNECMCEPHINSTSVVYRPTMCMLHMRTQTHERTHTTKHTTRTLTANPDLLNADGNASIPVPMLALIRCINTSASLQAQEQGTVQRVAAAVPPYIGIHVELMVM